MTRRYRIEGKVQGVFFRQSTRSEARRLGIRGMVRNLPDGSVEVVAYGSPSALDALQAWLHHGPAQARVDRVAEMAFEEQASMPEAFEVG